MQGFSGVLYKWFTTNGISQEMMDDLPNHPFYAVRPEIGEMMAKAVKSHRNGRWYILKN